MSEHVDPPSAIRKLQEVHGISPGDHLKVKAKSQRPKYAVFPDVVESKNDGDRHFINSVQLMRLYQVQPSECVVVFSPNDWHWWARLPETIRDSYIQLKPRYDGNYPCFENTTE